FPGHVALRPDYTFWNMMKVLRRMFDSNPERRSQREWTKLRLAIGWRGTHTEERKVYK
ncbi:hypothetical protein Y032_0494g2439, partial [Ancylostoma ceylanicum]